MGRAGSTVRRIDRMLSVRDGRLYVEAVDCVRLVARFGTTLYVVSEDQLRRNAREFAAAFAKRWSEGPVRILPSLKANYALALRHLLTQEGMGCDTFGEAELDAALADYRARDRRFGAVPEDPVPQLVSARA